MDDIPDPRYVPKHALFDGVSYVDEWIRSLEKIGVDAVKYVPYRHIQRVESGVHSFGHTVKLIPVQSNFLPFHVLHTRAPAHFGETSLFHTIESFIFSINLRREAMRDDVELLHYVSYFSSNFAFSFLPSRVLPIIAMYTGGDIPDSLLGRMSWLLALRPAMNAAKLLLIGDYPERVAKLKWLLGKRSHKIGTFDVLRVDTGVFRPADRVEAKQKQGIPPHSFNVLCVMSAIPLPHRDPNMRDPYTLLQVFKRALDELPESNTVLTIVGSGLGFEHLRRFAASLGLERHTRFIGSVNHVALPEYYAAADLVFVPFRLESLKHTHVLIEAFACARPAVAFKKTSSTPQDWDGGFMISPEAEEGGRALAKIVTNETVLQEKSMQTLRLSKAYDLHAGMARLVDFYMDVASKHR